MMSDYGTIEYREFQLNVCGAPDEGWCVTITRRGSPSKELNSIADGSMDVAIDIAKRWIDQIEFWRSQRSGVC